MRSWQRKKKLGKDDKMLANQNRFNANSNDFTCKALRIFLEDAFVFKTVLKSFTAGALRTSTYSLYTKLFYVPADITQTIQLATIVQRIYLSLHPRTYSEYHCKDLYLILWCISRERGPINRTDKRLEHRWLRSMTTIKRVFCSSLEFCFWIPFRVLKWSHQEENERCLLYR